MRRKLSFRNALPLVAPTKLPFRVFSPSPRDYDVVTTQMGHQIPQKRVVGVGQRCAHGYPQAVLFSPASVDESGVVRINSGSCFLTCPKLEKHVSKIEGYNDKGIKKYEDILRADPKLREQMKKVHHFAPQLRVKMLGEQFVEQLNSKDRKIFTETGACGISLRTPEVVKCLHYHLADFLSRHPPKPSLNSLSDPDLDKTSAGLARTKNTDCIDGDTETNPVNVVGKLVYDDLLKDGFDVSGDDECHKLCSKTCRGKASLWHGAS